MFKDSNDNISSLRRLKLTLSITPAKHAYFWVIWDPRFERVLRVALKSVMFYPYLINVKAWAMCVFVYNDVSAHERFKDSDEKMWPVYCLTLHTHTHKQTHTHTHTQWIITNIKRFPSNWRWSEASKHLMYGMEVSLHRNTNGLTSALTPHVDTTYLCAGCRHVIVMSGCNENDPEICT